MRIECSQAVIIATLFSLVHRIQRIRPLNNACGQEYVPSNFQKETYRKYNFMALSKNYHAIFKASFIRYNKPRAL